MKRERVIPAPGLRRTCARATAPEGGARSLKRQGVWGCVLLAACAAPTLAAEVLSVPSGQPVTLSEVIEDAVGGEDWLRFRFVAPQIARDSGTVTYDVAEADFAHLCDSVARPYLTEHALNPDVVVISLMDRQIEFGVTDPDATQFFEAFGIISDACVLETF